MYKLQTQLTHYGVNSIHNFGPITVTWFKLDESCARINMLNFNQYELFELSNYVEKNNINFQDQNYFTSNPDESPKWIINNSFMKFELPKYLILRKELKIFVGCEDRFESIGIELLNQFGNTNHNYNLSFNLIGKIEY